MAFDATAKTRWREDGEERRTAVLCAVATLSQRNNRPPTIRELGEYLDCTGVHHHIIKLETQGFIVRTPWESRSIRLTERGMERVRARRGVASSHRASGAAATPPTASMRLRVQGLIAAGPGIEAVEDRDPDSWIDVVPPGVPTFTLRVRGDSMIGDLISDGDVVVVQAASAARDGEIVVARLIGGPSETGELTVKHFYRVAPNIVRLEPSNPDMAPIILPAGEVEIKGRIVTVIRTIQRSGRAMR